MRRLGLLLAPLVLAAARNAASSGGKAAGPVASPTIGSAEPPSPSATPPSTPPAGSPCDAFETFYASMTSAPPEGRQIELERLAQRVEAAALASHSSRRLTSDATDLAAYVAMPSFPTEGNVLGQPIQRLVNVCF